MAKKKAKKWTIKKCEKRKKYIEDLKQEIEVMADNLEWEIDEFQSKCPHFEDHTVSTISTNTPNIISISCTICEKEWFECNGREIKQ